MASLFVSRWNVAVEEKAPAWLRDRLGIAMAWHTFEKYQELLGSTPWQCIFNAGARPQRLLWASTGTKDPNASDLLYVTALAAPGTINTMPEATLKALSTHGVIDGTVPALGRRGSEMLSKFTKAGIDIDAMADQLLREGVISFTKSWIDLLESIAAKSSALTPA